MTFKEFYLENTNNANNANNANTANNTQVQGLQTLQHSQHSHVKNNCSAKENVYCGISKSAFPNWEGWKTKVPETKETLVRNFWYLQYIMFLYYSK